MPVARIITTSPAESEELRRQLTAAGYSVKFAAPSEEFTDADIVVAAANVHADYALQYAAEVAAEADADVIVAPGVVRGSLASYRNEPISQPEQQEERASGSSVPVGGTLFGTASEVKDALADSGAGIRETLGDFGARIGGFLERLKEKRDVIAERKRLENEQRAIEREEQRRVLQQQRMEAEARMAVEREQLRARRQAEQERLRLEQQQMRRAMDEERARIKAERERFAIEQASAREAERERLAQLSPPSPVPAEPAPVQVHPAPAQRALLTPPVRRRARPVQRPGARRQSTREHRFQKAAFVASIVALVAMLGFAAALNIHPGSPMPHNMVQNPVQEKSPFGAASITPATSMAGVAAKPAAKPVAHTALPQHDTAPVAKPAPQSTKPSPSRARRAARDNYTAEDEVVVHHYGQAAQQKHPPATQQRAGVRRYSDQD